MSGELIGVGGLAGAGSHQEQAVTEPEDREPCLAVYGEASK
ncbi:hypothetical protein LCGC14_2652880, partial [marine sediment metagenome]